ncbi:MAG: hypothetical protein V3T70_07055, partial [Phycisphaerae bacterium]
EKQEITRRSPSHGNLCDSGDDASALAVYALNSGRCVVAASRHAGREHTARGGLRVYTHAAVFDDETYRRFRCDPLCVRDAFAAATGEAPILTPQQRLEPLELADPPLDRQGGTGDDAIEQDDVGRVLAVTAALLDGKSLIISSAPNPGASLRWIVAALPAVIRKRLTISDGLKFSLSRIFDLTIVQSPRPEVERQAEGRDVVVMDWPEAAESGASPFRIWLDFVRRCWLSGRIADIDWLTTWMDRHESPKSLRRIVCVCDDMERVETADRAALSDIQARHVDADGSDLLMVELSGVLRSAVESRSAALDEQEAKAADAEAAEAGAAPLPSPTAS